MKSLSLAVALTLLALAPFHANAQEDCLTCHREATPGAVRLWEQSAHAPAQVGCSDCHGIDHEAMESGAARVTAAVCGRCHEQAYAEHRRSRHGQGLHAGWGCTRNQPNRPVEECRFCHEEGSTLPVTTVQCARFLKQSAEMGEIGCNRCHMVEDSCASCHSAHATDPAIVAHPNVCAKCHMGPDHPQWEAWQTSQHGTLWTSAGGEIGPSCQRCHMPGGSHDVSGGLTAPPSGIPYPDAEQKAAREQMLEVCTPCHAKGFARRDLEKADAVRRQSLELLKEAEEILWDLSDRGLLSPMPDRRPPHPLRGPTLVTDGQMLYEDISHIERLFFKMKKYDFAKTIKGAYHQNPDYTHWYGNAEMKMDLVDIRAEAARLRKTGERPGEAPAEKENDLEGIEKELKVLKYRYERGDLSAEAYAEEKARLFEGVR